MASSLSEPAQNAVDAITGGDDIQATVLTGLSNLTYAEQISLRKIWPEIDEDRRVQVVSRLMELAEENIEYNFDAVFKICLDDDNEDIRYMAVEGLWENEESSLIDPLIRLLEDDSSEKVQSAAAIALGKFAVLAEFDKLRPENAEKIREALLGAIDDRNKAIEVSRRVLEAAAPLSLPDVKEAIADAYESGNRELLTSAIFSMGKSCDLTWIPVLVKEMNNPDPEIRYEVAGACGELESEEAVPGLIRLTDDEDMEVRLAAIQALGKIGGSEARERIETFLDSESEALREAAEEALGMVSSADDPLSFRT